MTAVRISLPAPADLIAHVLLGAARGADGPIEVHASRDGAELVVETVEATPSVSTQGVAVSPPVATPTPLTHPALAPESVSPCSVTVEPAPVPVTSTPPPAGLGDAGAGAELAGPVAGPAGRPVEPGVARTAPGSGAAIARCAECGAEFIKWRKDQRFDSVKCGQRWNSRASRQRKQAAAIRPVPVVPAHEKPEKPVRIKPVPPHEEEPLPTAAGPTPNPLAAAREEHPCPHCTAVLPTKKALGKHTAAIHPIRAMKPRHEPLTEPVHVVQPHTRRATA